MAKPRYHIKPEESRWAYAWLSRKFVEGQTWPFDPQGGQGRRCLQRERRYCLREFMDIGGALVEASDPLLAERLNDWAMRWLKRRHWLQLQAAIRARRTRDRKKKLVTVSLPHSLHKRLKRLAEEEGKAIHEVIESRIERGGGSVTEKCKEAEI